MVDSTTWPILDESLGLLSAAVVGITDDQYDSRTPCSRWTVSQVIEHATLDQFIWVSGITGAAGPDGDAFAPTGHFGGTTSQFVDSAVKAAVGAWSTVAPDDNHVPTPLPQGPMPAEKAAAACALDAAVHAWDIAVGIGRPSPLTSELASRLLPVAQSIAEPLRRWGAFGATVPAEPEDDATQTLLRYLGRDPKWMPLTIAAPRGC
jgi:uncharacterized protein (TIGR03086 family)